MAQYALEPREKLQTTTSTSNEYTPPPAAMSRVEMSRVEIRKRDHLAEIDGIKPRILLLEGQSIEATSQSSDRTYTMKRDMDQYHCTCLAWRRIGGHVSGRTCKHLQFLFGIEYEEARMELKNTGASDTDEKSTQATVVSKKRKVEDDSEDGQEEVEEKPTKKGRKVKEVAKPKPKASSSEEEEEEEEEKPTKKSAKGKEIAKRSAPANNSDDEEEEEKEKPAPKKTRNARAVSKKNDDDDSVEEEKVTRSRPKRVAPPVVKKNVSFKPLLADKWDEDKGRDPTGYMISEKLDGVRAYWDGTNFYSREGNPFYAPAWFTKRMPKDVTFDGELFTKRGGFQDCVSIVRTHNNPDAWKFSVTYQVFDCPSMASEPFEDRLEFCMKTFKKLGIRWVRVLEHTVCKDKAHVLEMLEDIIEKGGEGLMLREPRSLYINGRSKSLLKVKRFHDADAIVRAHERGSGKNSNCTGALRCEMLDAVTGKPTGTMFKIGTGLTDAQRRDPPKIGSIVIYRYQELSRSGNPRFPSFVGERAD